jgi:hypothetical protein
MMADYSTPATGADACKYNGDASCVSTSIQSDGASVRELEQLASAMRLAGDAETTEHVDQTILSLLEQKIYRKIMSQARRKRRQWSGIFC